MGIFDFWNKKNDDEKGTIGFNETKKEFGEAPQKKGPMAVYHPKGFGDIELIIDNLKRGNAVIVRTEELKPSTAIRVLDLLSGAVYALNGGVSEIEKNMFLFSPTGVDNNVEGF